jgi:hypothetical protein
MDRRATTQPSTFRERKLCRLRFRRSCCCCWEIAMGRGILLWLLGVPIPIIILLALIWH